MTSDRELIERIRAGDRQAWADAYRLYATDVRVAARRALGLQRPGGLTSDDVVHDVFTNMMRRALPEDLVSLRSYLVVAARHVVLDAVKSRSARLEMVEDVETNAPPALGEDPEELAISSALYVRVLEHLTELTQNERYVFVQRVMKERRRDEVAQELGVTPQRVSQLVAVATAKLGRVAKEAR